MFVYDQTNLRLFRVIAPRNRYYADGALDSYWAYKVEEVTSQVIENTTVDRAQ